MSIGRLIVIGGGNMALAIVRGGVAGGVLTPSQILVAEPVDDRRSIFQSIGIATVARTEDVRAALDSASMVILAVKPQVLPDVARSIGSAGYPGLVVSILAGASAGGVHRAMGGRCRVVRVMPNTPATVGMGVSGVCPGPGATLDDLAAVESLFNAVGEVVRIDESNMDAFTAVGGSGPAYVFLLAEALTSAARDAGLSDEAADRVVRGTIRGAAELLARSGEGAAALRRAVTSPGGTTAAAIGVLETGGFGSLMRDAVIAARDRGTELGRENR